MKGATLTALNEARKKREGVIHATWLDSGESWLICRDDAPDADLARDVGHAFRLDQSRTLEVRGRPLFLHVFNPPARLVIVGAVHVAQPLAVLARTTGVDPVIVDPRRAWADARRFPDVRVVEAWPDDALAQLKPDHRTAVAALTHDPRIDDPALIAALNSPAFYIGALGSRRSHARRLERLADEGLDGLAMARIHGPVGLDIGARSAEEIALSIMAEIVAARNGKLP